MNNLFYNQQDDGKLFSTKEAAEYLGLPRSRVWKLCREHYLPPYPLRA